MRSNQINRHIPLIPVSLGVDLLLYHVLNPKDPLNKVVRQEISKALIGILKILGIPGRPQVKISLNENTAESGRFLRLRVHKQICRYSDELLQRIYSYVNGVPLGPEANLYQIRTWLDELCGTQTKTLNNQYENLAAFLSLTCVEIIKSQPAVLLERDQVVSYKKSLPDPEETSDLQPGTWPPNQIWLRSILAKVLNLKISLANKQAVTHVLKEGLLKGRTQEDITEDLVDALRSEEIEIQLSQEYLRQITTADVGEEYNRFDLMRDGLFYELGLRYPKFRFVPVEDLKPYGFRFKINHLTTVPRIGIQPDQCLVNDTPNRLKLIGIQKAIATLNPTNMNESSLIDLKSQQSAKSAGLTTWNPMAYLILSFSVDLRENSISFVYQQMVQNQIDQLEQAFPALIEAVRIKAPTGQITRVLRALVSEEISIRNLRSIFESLLDHDYIITDSAKYIIFDDRLPTPTQPNEAWFNDQIPLASLVRSNMKRYLSHKYTRGQSTLIVYLLDPEIEKILSEGTSHKAGKKGKIPLYESQCNKILEAIRAEVGTQPALTSIPAILTTIDVRPHLRKITALEFPRLPILSYGELSPDLNIQPIARISLDN